MVIRSCPVFYCRVLPVSLDDGGPAFSAEVALPDIDRNGRTLREVSIRRGATAALAAALRQMATTIEAG